MEEIECRMKTVKLAPKIKVNVDDVLNKDDIEYYEDESYDDKKFTSLLQMNAKDLPCPKQYIEQIEHPSTREFIGFDLSWIRSAATTTNHIASYHVISIIFIALMSQFACTLAAFFR